MVLASCAVQNLENQGKKLLLLPLDKKYGASSLALHKVKNAIYLELELGGH